MKVYQILTTVAYGDAVSNDCLAIGKLLEEKGYKNIRKQTEFGDQVKTGDIGGKWTPKKRQGNIFSVKIFEERHSNHRNE